MTRDRWVATITAGERWLHNYSDGTREQYRIALASLCDYGRRHDVAPIDMTTEQLRGWLDELRTVGNLASSRGPQPIGHAGLTRMGAAAHSFLRRASSHASSPVPRVKQRGAAPAKVEHLSAETVRDVHVQAQIAGPAVEALVQLLLAGMRVSEAIRVTPEDLTDQGVRVSDGRTLSSHRVVPLPPETRRVLGRYPKGVPFVHGLGGSDGRRHAQVAVERLGGAVGVELSPRMLTGYAIAEQLARGVPVHIVQRNAGHRDIRSTLRYAPEGTGDPVAAGAALLAERFGLEKTVAREYVDALRSSGLMAH
jgi:integrase